MGRRLSLLEKISGPDAVPLAILIRRGEAAAERVHADFGVFLHQRIQELARMRGGLDAENGESWRPFYAAVVDLCGSSATAGRMAVNAVSASLERLMTERVQEARSFQVIGSHVDALVLLASGSPESCGSAETQTLIAELEQAVNLLPLGKSSLKE
jgi:hypothetical protein